MAPTSSALLSPLLIQFLVMLVHRMLHAADIAERAQGPVGRLLKELGRHNMRPAHLHIMVSAPGYEKLVTSFYPEGDKYITSDAVFGVKKSLVVVRRSRPLLVVLNCPSRCRK